MKRCLINSPKGVCEDDELDENLSSGVLKKRRRTTNIRGRRGRWRERSRARGGRRRTGGVRRMNRSIKERSERGRQKQDQEEEEEEKEKEEKDEKIG